MNKCLFSAIHLKSIVLYLHYDLTLKCYGVHAGIFGAVWAVKMGIVNRIRREVKIELIVKNLRDFGIIVKREKED